MVYNAYQDAVIEKIASGKTFGKRRHMLLFFIIMSLTAFICSGADEKCLNENKPKRDAAVRVKVNKF